MQVSIHEILPTVDDITVCFSTNHIESIHVQHSDFEKYLQDNGYLEGVIDYCQQGEHVQEEVKADYFDFLRNGDKDKAMKKYLESILFEKANI